EVTTGAGETDGELTPGTARLPGETLMHLYSERTGRSKAIRFPHPHRIDTNIDRIACERPAANPFLFFSRQFLAAVSCRLFRPASSLKRQRGHNCFRPLAEVHILHYPVLLGFRKQETAVNYTSLEVDRNVNHFRPLANRFALDELAGPIITQSRTEVSEITRLH